jgi:hypothetical protein
VGFSGLPNRGKGVELHKLNPGEKSRRPMMAVAAITAATELLS